jgi:hypothetical protein
LRANLAIDISNSNLNNGVLADFADLAGTGNWKIFEGSNTLIDVTSGSASTEWTGGTQMIRYAPNLGDYFWRYTFDSRTYSGTTIYDVSGTNAATMNGDVAINLTAANQPPSFGDGYLTLVDNTSPVNFVSLPSFVPDMVKGTSFAFWAYFDSTTRAYSYVFSFGLNNVGDNAGSAGVIRFGRSTSTNLNLAVYNSSGGSPSSDINITGVNGAWNHYVWVLVPGPSSQTPSPGKDATWYLYTNGVLTNTFTSVDYLLNQTYAANSFGRTNFPSTPSFSGRLDDFQMFKRALSADEVTLIYKNISQLSNYAFEPEDVSGTTVSNNMITKIYDGTLMSGAQIRVDGNSRIPGKGYLFLTDPTNSYFKFKPFSFTTSGISFSVWVNIYALTNVGGARIFDIRTIGSINEVSLTVTSLTSLRFLVNTGGGAPSYTYSGLTNLVNTSNIWTHLAMSITYGTGTSAIYRFYHNGVLKSPDAGNGMAGYTTLGFRAAYNIGGYGNSDGSAANTERLDGCVDDFQWFNYPLSATEVSQIYNNTFDIVKPYNKIGSSVLTTSLPAYSVNPASNLLFPSQTGYTVKANEITLSPGTNNTYCIWTSPKTATYALDVSFADFGLRTDGVGFQIFTINANNTYKQQLFSRTVTPTALTNVGGSYLSIPRYLVSLNTGDKIYLRVDLGVANTTNDGSVISALIYEQVAS